MWLCPVADLWQVANFSHKTSVDRSQWRRSQSVVSGVRIVEQPDGDDSEAWNPWRLVHSRGLPTDEGPSTVYVEFHHPDIDKEIVRQMVPVDFLPGEGGVAGGCRILVAFALTVIYRNFMQFLKAIYCTVLSTSLTESNLATNSGIKACIIPVHPFP